MDIFAALQELESECYTLNSAVIHTQYLNVFVPLFEMWEVFFPACQNFPLPDMYPLLPVNYLSLTDTYLLLR